jgi:hypothetical protein
VKVALPKRELGIPTTVSPPGPLVLMFVPRLSVAPRIGLPVMVSAAMITGVTGGGVSAAAGAAANSAEATNAAVVKEIGLTCSMEFASEARS